MPLVITLNAGLLSGLVPRSRTSRKAVRNKHPARDGQLRGVELDSWPGFLSTVGVVLDDPGSGMIPIPSLGLNTDIRGKVVL